MPNTYFKSDELKYLVSERSPHKIPNAQLKRFAEKMLDIADNLANEATGAINLLPTECQRAGTLTAYLPSNQCRHFFAYICVLQFCQRWKFTKASAN